MGMGDLGRMKELVRPIEAGRLDLTPLVTHRMSFDDAIRGLRDLRQEAEGAIKILLDHLKAPTR